jgi:hypothetical protein
MSDDDLVIDREMEEEDEYESSGSSSQTKERENVYISLSYGTKLFREDQPCEHCDELADGVLVVGDCDDPGSDLLESHVVCQDHRIGLVREAELGFDETEWHSFEAEGDN